MASRGFGVALEVESDASGANGTADDLGAISAEGCSADEFDWIRTVSIGRVSTASNDSSTSGLFEFELSVDWSTWSRGSTKK